MKIAIDFDGTCVMHEFPAIGLDCPNAVKVLRELVADGHELFLYTMRSRIFLEHAVDWFKLRSIELSGIQYDPDQSRWTSSNKCYANIYIDDAALGAPLIHSDLGRPYIDWIKVKQMINALDVEPNPIIKA